MYIEIMTAYDWLNSLPWIPVSIEGRNVKRPSKSEVGRWLDNRAVIVNGEAAKRDTLIEEVRSLVFFPKGKRRTTMA